MPLTRAGQKMINELARFVASEPFPHGNRGVRPLIDNGDGTFSVPLSKGLVAIIDAEDADDVGRCNWNAALLSDRWYAQRMVPVREREEGKPSCIKLHRFIMGLDKPDVDHVDGNGLNCRRSNMRHCTDGQNSMNRGACTKNPTGFKGVRGTESGRWHATIGANRSYRFLGAFDTAEDAARAYDRAAVVLHGEFAKTNFPTNQPESRSQNSNILE